VTIKTDTRSVLIGYALLFDEIIPRPDFEPVIVRSTAFHKPMRGAAKYFLHEHDNNINIGSTEHHLTLHTDSRGLGFKLYIPRTPLGERTRDYVRSNFKEAMSAGYTVTKCETAVVNDEQVMVVTEAELREISLVKHGANESAFAVLVDDSAEWITDMCESGRLVREMRQAHEAREQRRSGQMTYEDAAENFRQTLQSFMHDQQSETTSNTFG
jgi:HK97 family phage prohead protease